MAESLPIVNSSGTMLPQDAQEVLNQAAAVTSAFTMSEANSSGQQLSVNATQRLVATVEAVQSSLTRGLFRSFNGSQASTPQVLTVQSPALTMTVAALPPASGQVTVGPGSLPGVPLAQNLPQEALAAATQALASVGSGSSQIGISSCRWKGFNPLGPAKISETQQEVKAAGDIISLSITDSKGKLLPIQNLGKPIVLAIPISLVKPNFTQDDVEQMLLDGSFPQCRWWNETLRSWQGEGCKGMSLQKRGMELLCACTHLTTFGAFVSPLGERGLSMGDIEGVFQFLWMILTQCANVASLWSAEGTTALQAGTWASRGSASSVFIVMSLLLLALPLAFFVDRFNYQDLRAVWSRMEHVHWFDLKVALLNAHAFIWHPVLWKRSMARGLVLSVVGQRLGISQDTVEIILEAQRERPGFQPDLEETRNRPWLSLEATITKAACRMNLYKESVLEDFTFQGIPERESLPLWRWLGLLLRRACYLYLRTLIAGHPIMFLGLSDLYILPSQRALLFAVQYLGAIFGNAFWFQSAGMTLTFGSPDECIMTNLADRIHKALPVSLVCVLISAGPSQILYYMISARPRGENALSKARKDALLCALSYTLGFSLLVWYLLYLCAFLANVHESSAELWMLSAFQSVLCSLIVLPLLQALIYTGFVICFLLREPTLAADIFTDEPWRPSSGGKRREGAPEAEPGATEHRVIHVRAAALEHRVLSEEEPQLSRVVFSGPLDEADDIALNHVWPSRVHLLPDPEQVLLPGQPRPVLALQHMLG